MPGCLMRWKCGLGDRLAGESKSDEVRKSQIYGKDVSPDKT